MRRPLFIAGTVLVLLVVAAVALVVVRLRDDGPDTRLAAAVALAPADSQRFSWTDWSEVRAELGSDVSADSSTTEVADFLDAGFDADLTSTSALLESADVLQESYGVSPASLDWELFAQGEAGALLVLGLPDSLDVDDLRDTLGGLGYEEPDQADGVWGGGADLLAGLGPVTPELAYVALDEERRVLVASDEQDTVADWQDDARGTDVEDGVSDVLAATGEPLSASIYTGEHACSALAMSQADDTERARASQLIAAAGEIHPLAGFAIAALPGGDVRVSMAFETEEQARTNADSRSQLASGPAPGQGGDFADRFELGEVAADERVVTMELTPLPGSFVVSDLGHGPVLFATC